MNGKQTPRAGLGEWIVSAWRSRAGSGGSTPSLQLLETLGLGNRNALHLVRCGDRKYIVGTSAESMTLVACDTEIAGGES